MHRTRFAHLFFVAAGSAALLSTGIVAASAAQSGNGSSSLPKTIKIAQITSLTGALAIYGPMQEAGFAAGLDYATHGSDKVLGSKLQVSVMDDATDPNTAVSDAKTALNNGANIIQCCAYSADAIPVAQLMPTYKKIDMVAPAADDALTGINKYTFRTSREDSQDAITGAKYAVQHFGKTYMTLAQNFAFGQDQEKVWNDQLKPLGAKNKGNILLDLTTTDFKPTIDSIKHVHPKWLFVAWAGVGTALFDEMKSDGLFKAGIKVMTGLPNVEAIPTFGSAVNKMGFISDYYYTFPHTKANDYLKSWIHKNYKKYAGHAPVADIFDQDSFAAAQELVAAIQKAHSIDTNKLINALQGQTVQGPKGPYTIRKQDHLCIQPMYIATVKVEKGGKLVPKLLKTVTPKPPVVKMG
jgi:branched-chain amino acid transport system substrate-binding protein